MKKALTLITIVIGVALLALLAYSVERSAWLLALYETAATEGEDQSGPALAMAAALVAELGKRHAQLQLQPTRRACGSADLCRAAQQYGRQQKQ